MVSLEADRDQIEDPLDGAHGAARTGHMLQQQESSTWTENAAYFTDRLPVVRDRSSAAVAVSTQPGGGSEVLSFGGQKVLSLDTAAREQPPLRKLDELVVLRGELFPNSSDSLCLGHSSPSECRTPLLRSLPTFFFGGERPDGRAVRSRVPSGGGTGSFLPGISSRASCSPHSRRKGSIGREFYQLRSLARALLVPHAATWSSHREARIEAQLPPSTLSVARGRHSGTSRGSERQSTDGVPGTCAAVDIVQENR